MKPAYRGIAITVLHCLLVLTVAGKYAWDRDRLPRAWANATPIEVEDLLTVISQQLTAAQLAGAPLVELR